MNTILGRSVATTKCLILGLKQTSVPVSTIRFYNARWRRPTLEEIDRRRHKQELNYLVKDGAVPFVRRSEFIEWNYSAELKAFTARVGETFDIRLLTTAFTAQSYVDTELHKQKQLGIDTIKSTMKSNNELASKGQILIDNTISSWLRCSLPAFPEEGIQSLKEFLICEEMLANISYHIGTRELTMSQEYPPNAATLSQVFKAIVAALAETNPERAEKFILDIVAAQLAGKDVNEIWSVSNPMGVLAHILEKEKRGPPEPRLMWTSGPKTILACFHVGIYSDKDLIGESSGESVEIAEEMAARDALRILFNTSDSMSPLPLGKRATVQSKLEPNFSIGDRIVLSDNENEEVKKPSRIMNAFYRRYVKG